MQVCCNLEEHPMWTVSQETIEKAQNTFHLYFIHKICTLILEKALLLGEKK